MSTRGYNSFIKWLPDQYTLVGDYINNDTKVKIHCSTCNSTVQYLPDDRYENRKIQCKCTTNPMNNHRVLLKNKNREEAQQYFIDNYDNFIAITNEDKQNGNKYYIKCIEHDITIELKYTKHYYMQNKTNICPKCRVNGTLSDRELNFINTSSNVHNNKYDYSLVKYINNTTKVDIICPIHGKFEQTPLDHIQGHGCKKCSHHLGISESELIEFMDDNNINYIHGDRKLIAPKEIDILIPDFKFGIEYNGIFWHSYEMLNDKKYHLNKTESLEKSGYQLFHIFENEYIDPVKREIWYSMLRNKLNLIPKDNIVYARKCHIREISSSDAALFLDNNHMQGNKYSKINLGLYYNDDLVSLMTFSKDPTKQCEYDLIRFCNKINHRVIGAASKLLKYFERTYNPTSIISYANRRWSQGNLYEALGFTFIRNSEPNYFYFKDYNLLSRKSFQKHMLKNKLEIYDETKTEYQNMLDNKYNSIYDSGNKVYIKKY